MMRLQATGKGAHFLKPEARSRIAPRDLEHPLRDENRVTGLERNVWERSVGDGVRREHDGAGYLARLACEVDAVAVGNRAESACERDRLDEREARGEREGAGFLHLAEHDDP